jgi:pimeloyl-ACP methyl ester carboxylesterase
MTSRVDYDEFGLFHENATEYGLPFEAPPLVRREFVEVEPGRRLSALVWGSGEPQLVLLHGGAQNAHTWDTVALALGESLVAIDLPGHGHSDGFSDRAGAIGPTSHAIDVAAAIRVLAPKAKVVVGMSLGGLTTMALMAATPELVRSAVLVDITPGVTKAKAHLITSFVNGPKTFASFDDLLARTVEFNPTRTVASLRRGILHNAHQLDSGEWVWRYRRFDVNIDSTVAATSSDSSGLSDHVATPSDAKSDAPLDTQPLDPSPLWDVLAASTVPLMLVRGMLAQSVVDDADESELLRRRPDARIEHIANAGHSVQGDTPIELAVLLADFVGAHSAAS